MLFVTLFAEGYEVHLVWSVMVPYTGSRLVIVPDSFVNFVVYESFACLIICLFTSLRIGPFHFQAGVH